MSHHLQAIEIIGHAAVSLTFALTSLYILVNRRLFHRMLRRPASFYWLILAGSVFFGAVNLLVLKFAFLSSPVGGGATAAWLDLVSEYPSMIAESLLILALIGKKIMSERGPRSLRVLAVGAHPDDLEIACGATLAKMHDASYTIRGLVMTRGGQGGNADHRPQAAIRGAAYLGLDEVQVFDFCDTELASQAVELVRAIEAEINRFEPDIILTHSLHDIHQDHQAVHEAVSRAGRNQPTILCYESPSVTPDFAPSFFVDIADYVEVKIVSIREHWDQRHKPYVQPERVRGVAVFRGGQAKVRYAEGFEVVRALSSHLGGI